MRKFDVIVVGSGIAGATVARLMAREGLNVALIERQGRTALSPNKRGEAVEPGVFQEVDLPEPAGAELVGHLHRYRLYSPRRGPARVVTHQHLIVDRRHLDRRLLETAERAGVKVFDGTEVAGVHLDEHGVAGAVVAGPGGEETWQARLTIDASGLESVIRRRLPASMQIDTRHPLEGIARSCRLTYEETSGPAGEVDIYIQGQGIYLWRSPYDVGARALDTTTDLRSMVRDFALEQGRDPDLASAWVETKVPLARHIGNLVGDGILILGDAAGMCNPANGYGVTTGLLAAQMAGEIALSALQRGRADRESLWPFNLRYCRRWGANHAALDVLRCFLRFLGEEEMNYLWERHLLVDSDLELAFNGELVVLSLAEKLRRLARASRDIVFLIDLDRCMEIGKKARRLYEDFPKHPHDLAAWREKGEKLFAGIPLPQLAR